MSLLREDNGNFSTTRVGYFIKLFVGVFSLGYCIYQKWMPIEMALVLGGLFGLNEISKVVSKKLEK